MNQQITQRKLHMLSCNKVSSLKEIKLFTISDWHMFTWLSVSSDDLKKQKNVVNTLHKKIWI